MTKPPKKLPQLPPVASEPVQEPQPVPEAVVVRDEESRIIKPERFCPICWENRRGYGVAYSTSANGTRYYRCKCSAVEGGSPCGWTWSMSPQQIEAARVRYQDYLKSVIVEHRDITLDGTR